MKRGRSRTRGKARPPRGGATPRSRAAGGPLSAPPPLVGLTGGIAAGKSVVASTFARLGALVISADREARGLIARDPAVIRAMKRILGPSSYRRDGSPDRGEIARRIFSSSPLRRRVNAAVHPAVIARIRRIAAAARRERRRPMIVVETALLYEAGMAPMFDAVVAVDAPVAARVERIRRRDGIARAEALRRVRAQAANDRALAAADITIANRGDLRSLRAAARFVFGILAGGAGRPGRR